MKALHAPAAGVPAPALPGLELPAAPRRDGPPPVVISWGLGRDSSTILALALGDPRTLPMYQSLGYDPATMIVIHAVTGDEWDDTLRDAEHHILPLLREHGVRLVQVARGGPFEADGIEILDDSRSPTRLHKAGPWRLSDELRTSGTVPMLAHGRRTCSVKFKGSVIDRFIAADLQGCSYRHVLGFNADEGERVLRDQTYTSATRAPEYPLITWGYDTADCVALLRERFGVTWKKSYCVQCPFPGNIGGLPGHLERLRAFPERAAEVLMLEHVALSLNPNSRLFGSTTLRSHVVADRNTEALTAFRHAQAAGSWSVYQVRRILWPRGDEHLKGPAWRSVRTLGVAGSHAEATQELRRRAGERGGVIEVDEHRIARVWERHRGETYPTREAFDVVAPAVVLDKARPEFATAWGELEYRAKQPLLPGS
ncbi:hypothetical protein [Streptomyces sp. NEAU-S7GS2]|uniref:hypothetical protein n=1 Tax=Streptomyces sp. NEAU-S7GS2 TaxID=2202000 RepID=UPI000D6EB2E6|nr:hypothetical protein [Streptomyces sp. NEAU-S7GS2]AWN24779.1 hypothetical protein DKG71_00035 [Streptomyces sp. NEAU-S7GS2]